MAQATHLRWPAPAAIAVTAFPLSPPLQSRGRRPRLMQQRTPRIKSGCWRRWSPRWVLMVCLLNAITPMTSPLAYSLVLLLGTTTAVICTTISTFCCSACSFFLEENMEMAFRVVSPFLGLPVALFMLQLFCLFYALLQDSRLSSLLVFKLSIGCAAVFLTCFSAYIRHYALAACVPAVGQEAIHPTASPSTSSGPRTQARTRSRSKRRSGQSEAHNV